MYNVITRELEAGEPPVWNSANAPGGDENNAVCLAMYKPLAKCP